MGSVSASLPATGSMAPPVTVAVLLRLVVADGETVAWIVTAAPAAGARPPSVQVTVPAACTQPAVAETNVTCPGSASVTVMPGEVDGPRFVTRIVYVSAPPGATGSGESLFASDRSARGVRPSVSVAVLLPGAGSSTPAGGATLAVFARVPVAAGAMVPVSTNVALPPASRSTLAAMSPLPFAGQAEPTDAVQVQLAAVTLGGKVSVTAAAVTAAGPAFDATIV